MKLRISPTAKSVRPSASTAIIAAIVVATLDLGRAVLIPIAFAGLLSFVLTPPLTRLQKLGLGRVPAVVALTLFSFTLLAGVTVMLGNQMTQLASNLPQYQYGLGQKINSARDMASNGAMLRSVTRIVQGLGRQISQPAQPQPQPTAPSVVYPAPPDSPPETPPLPVVVRQPPPTPYEIASQVLGPLIEPMVTAGIVIIFVVFILLQREDLRDRLIWFAGARDLRRTTVALDDAGARLSRFFLAQTAINTAFGFVLGICLWLIGIPNFILWGSLATFLRFLPYIGGILSAIFPLILAAAVDPGWSKLLWTAGVFAGLELVTGQFIEPLLFGRATGMSPVAVIAAATFWTWIWGPVGLMLSTPLTLLLVVLGQHVERFNFFAVLFGDSPPLAPEESFYHRIISGHADEAIEQAYGTLKEHSLIEYYDEVSLPGLRLLQYDFNEGLLQPDSLAKLTATIDEIVEVAGEYEEAGEQTRGEDSKDAKADAVFDLRDEWRGEAPVLCIAGRSPFDHSVATMLKQLLARKGIGMRIADVGMTAPSRLAKFDTEGAALICLSYLAVDHSPSQARFIIRRLRRRGPGIKIMVGFWAATEDAESDTDPRLALKADSGADYVATTLSEALSICLEEGNAPTRRQNPEELKAPAAS